MIGESIGGEQCSNLAHLPFSKKSRGEKGRVCGFTVRTVLQAEKSIGWMRRVVVVVAEKGWEVSPPPDGSPLLANWQNHPAGTGEAICMMDQSRKRHSHTLECIRRVAGKKAKSKMICFQLLPSIILTEVQGSGGRIQEVEMSPLQHQVTREMCEKWEKVSCLVEEVFLVFLGKTEFSHVVSGVSL